MEQAMGIIISWLRSQRSANSQLKPYSYRFRVQGNPFEVSSSTLDKLESEVLNTLVGKSSGSLPSEDCIYDLNGVQPESFHSFIGFAMHGELVFPSSLNIHRLLNDATVLGIKGICMKMLERKKKTTDPISYRFCVQGTPFEVPSMTLHKLQSTVLNKIVDNNSGFLVPQDDIHILDGVQPESFHVLIGFAMHNEMIFPSSLNAQRFLNDADFLGIKGTCMEMLAKEKKRISLEREQFLDQSKILLDKWIDRSFDLGIAKGKNSGHHNYRYDDGAGRVYCVDCHNRDIDSRFFTFPSPSVYIDRTKCCNKKLMYSKQLGWCHKCQKCIDCQQGDCPNDDDMNCTADYWGDSYKKKYDFDEQKITMRKDAVAEFSKAFLNGNFARTKDKIFMESNAVV